MKIPEMAWITQINYTSSYSCIYFIIQNIYILSISLEHQELATSMTESVDFLCEGAL